MEGLGIECCRLFALDLALDLRPRFSPSIFALDLTLQNASETEK